MTVHLIIGEAGQVGEHLSYATTQAGLSTVGVDFAYQDLDKHLDIRIFDSVQSLIASARPTVVYLPAALSNVDYCELHPVESYNTNVIGVANVVRASNEVDAKIVYFSSDYIFDGLSGPYTERDTANPINEYGRQKLMAEHFVALHAYNYLIIRTTVVYGWEQQGKNFVYRLINTVKGNQTLRVPVDQIGTPAYAPNLAQVVVELANQNASGVYNVVGPERVNRYEFACEAARVFGLDENLIKPVSTSLLAQPARRPLNAGLVTDKVSAIVKIPLVGFQDGLRIMALASPGN
jgi:dTDP-4-dehydrorhamnose reductase